MLRRRTFLPTAGVTTPLTSFDWWRHNVRCQMEPEAFPTDRLVTVGINSFGIGWYMYAGLVEEA